MKPAQLQSVHPFPTEWLSVGCCFSCVQKCKYMKRKHEGFETCVKRFIQTFITPEQNIHNVYHFTSQTSCAYIHTLCSLRQWHSKAFHVQFRVFGTAVQWQNTTKGTMLCLEEATNCHCQPWTKVFLEQEQFSSNCNQSIYKCISPPTHLSTTSRE